MVQEHERLRAEAGTPARVLRPDEIIAALDQYVVGQQHAKETLAVALYNHVKRIRLNATLPSDERIEKSNILLIGPTGCGKTLLARSAARTIDVPFVIVPLVGMSESGYVGEKVEDALRDLLDAAGGDIARAERGIVYFDELDKTARVQGTVGIDVSREGVQRGLIPLIEGRIVSVKWKDPKTGKEDLVPFDTKDVLFVLSGAFEGLWKTVRDRLKKDDDSTIGFSGNPKKVNSRREYHLLREVTTEDFEKYGLRKEIIGRMPVVAIVDELSEDDLVDVLVKPKNALVTQFQKLFREEGVALEVTPEALRAIARVAKARGPGARELRSVIEEILLPAQCAIPALVAKERGEGTENPLAKVVVHHDPTKNGFSLSYKRAKVAI